MNMSQQRGSIRHLEAYARGKMLNHSSWQSMEPSLPRNITPSDFDLVFDNGGNIIYGEVSSQFIKWKELSSGQADAYRNAIKDTTHCAALCSHSVRLSEQRQIDTRKDIDSFQVMLHRSGGGFEYTRVFKGNDYWQRFILRWYEDPEKVRTICRGFLLNDERPF